MIIRLPCNQKRCLRKENRILRTVTSNFLGMGLGKLNSHWLLQWRMPKAQDRKAYVRFGKGRLPKAPQLLTRRLILRAGVSARHDLPGTGKYWCLCVRFLSRTADLIVLIDFPMRMTENFLVFPSKMDRTRNTKTTMSRAFRPDRKMLLQRWTVIEARLTADQDVRTLATRRQPRGTTKPPIRQWWWSCRKIMGCEPKMCLTEDTRKRRVVQTSCCIGENSQLLFSLQTVGEDLGYASHSP